MINPNMKPGNRAQNYDAGSPHIQDLMGFRSDAVVEIVGTKQEQDRDDRGQ